MTTSSCNFMPLTGKDITTSGNSVKQLPALILIFLLYISTYTQTHFLVKSIIQLWIGGAMDLLWFECLCPSQLLCWNPNVHCKGTGRCGCGRRLGHKVGALLHLCESTAPTELSSPSHYVRTQRAAKSATGRIGPNYPLSPSHEVTGAGSSLRVKRGEPSSEPDHAVTWSALGLHSLQNCEKIIYFSHPVYGILLWHSKLTNTAVILIFSVFKHTSENDSKFSFA